MPDAPAAGGRPPRRLLSQAAMFALALLLTVQGAAASAAAVVSASAAPCPNYCWCNVKPRKGGSRSYTACLSGLATNPPANAVMVNPILMFGPALQMDLLAAKRKRCASTLGVAADCLRQRLTTLRRYRFSPKLQQGACACPSDAVLCARLPKLSTAAYGRWVPDQVYRLLKCATPPPAGNRPHGLAKLGDTFCDGYKDTINSIVSSVLDSVWPSVQKQIPSTLQDLYQGDFEGGFLLSEADAHVELTKISDLSKIPVPAITIESVPTCSNMSFVSANIKGTAKLDKLTVKGQAGIQLYPLFYLPMSISATAYLTLNLQSISLELLADANAGLTGSLVSGYQGCASIPQFTSVKLTAGSISADVDGWVMGIIPAGWLADWLVELLVEKMAPTVISSWVPDLLKAQLNSKAVLSLLTGCVKANPLGWCNDPNCEACFVEADRCERCRASPPSVLIEGACALCSANCHTCVAGGSGSGATQCTKCEDSPPSILSNGTCLLCGPLCEACVPSADNKTAGATSCWRCQKTTPPVALVAGKCLQCGQHCTKCQASGSEAACAACEATWYPSDAGCKKCPDGCDACSGQQCSSCSPGYFLSSGACKPCNVEHCVECYREQQCSKCSPGYVPFNAYRAPTMCLACRVPNCATCVTPNSDCSECKSGFTLRSGQCVAGSF